MTRHCVSCGADIDARPGLAWRIVYDSTVGYGCADCIVEPLNLLNVFDARAGQTFDPVTWATVTWLVVRPQHPAQEASCAI